ncbi:MAG: NAD-dependent epimerase/dehydratase family protein, partial [Longimicrobiales bacterium]
MQGLSRWPHGPAPHRSRSRTSGPAPTRARPYTGAVSLEQAHEQPRDVAAIPPRVLLTGATGFVGSQAAQAFVSAGHRVRALVRSH